MSRLIKPVYISYRAIRRHFRRVKETFVMEEIRIASVYFRASAIISGFCNFVACFLFYFARSCASALRGTKSACVLRLHFSLFIFILRSASLFRSRHDPAPRSHLCHPCIVFTSHAAYIILTSVARGNVRHFSVFLPIPLLRLLHVPLEESTAGRTPLRCNLNNYTTRAMK